MSSDSASRDAEHDGASAPAIVLHVVGPDDAPLFDRVADEVFDHPIDREMLAEFLADPRHHMVLALDGETVVGMCSGFHYVHPDKRPQLWINEVGVTPPLRRRGIASRLVGRMVDVGRTLGCTEAWLLTEPDNLPARALYESLEGEEFAGGVVGFSFSTSELPGPAASGSGDAPGS